MARSRRSRRRHLYDPPTVRVHFIDPLPPRYRPPHKKRVTYLDIPSPARRPLRATVSRSSARGQRQAKKRRARLASLVSFSPFTQLKRKLVQCFRMTRKQLNFGGGSGGPRRRRKEQIKRAAHTVQAMKENRC